MPCSRVSIYNIASRGPVVNNTNIVSCLHLSLQFASDLFIVLYLGGLSGLLLGELLTLFLSNLLCKPFQASPKKGE